MGAGYCYCQLKELKERNKKEVLLDIGLILGSTYQEKEARMSYTMPEPMTTSSPAPTTPSRLPRPKAPTTPSGIPRLRPQSSLPSIQRDEGRGDAHISTPGRVASSPKTVASRRTGASVSSSKLAGHSATAVTSGSPSARPRVVGSPISSPRAPFNTTRRDVNTSPKVSLTPTRAAPTPRKPTTMNRPLLPSSPTPSKHVASPIPRVRTISQPNPTLDARIEDHSEGTLSRRAGLSIREQIAAKRKALLEEQEKAKPHTDDEGISDLLSETFQELDISTSKMPTSPTKIENSKRKKASQDVFGRTVPSLISKAFRSGRLDIGNLSLPRMPKEVWTKIIGLEEEKISIPYDTTMIKDTAITGMSEVEEEEQVETVPYYEQVDVVHLRASGNEFRFIEVEIDMLASLRILDLHGNKLRELPNSIINLRELTHLDISSNEFNVLPKSAILLPSLISLDISDNHLSSLNFDDPIRPSTELLASRKESGFFKAFPSTPKGSEYRDVDIDEVLPLLKELRIAKNRLTITGLPETWPRQLEGLDLSENQMKRTMDITSLAGLVRLRYINLKGNGLDKLIISADASERPSWPSLAAVDLSSNALADVRSLQQAFKVEKEVVLTKDPIKRSRMSLTVNSTKQLIIVSALKL